MRMRHCMNRWCNGFEFWEAISYEKYEDCPACGYPCTAEDRSTNDPIDEGEVKRGQKVKQ